MLELLRSYVDTAKNRNLAYTAGGLVALLGGRKVAALGMFAKGIQGLEKAWREAHPDFDGDLRARWDRALEFYEATHKNETNRKLHVIGIPFIVAGTAGLLLFPAYRPMWSLSAAAFVGGWALNFIGHGIYERNSPAFSKDPLSFVAGPVWDFQQLLKKRATTTGEPAADVTPGANGSATRASA